MRISTDEVIIITKESQMFNCRKDMDMVQRTLFLLVKFKKFKKNVFTKNMYILFLGNDKPTNKKIKQKTVLSIDSY